MGVVDSKNRNTDVILKLKIKEGAKGATNSQGLLDNRLFKGENNIHLMVDPQYMHYFFKYDSGGLPEPFRQRFTSYDKAFNFAKAYFDKRNVEIAEVLD